jgi:hypothetical protein
MPIEMLIFLVVLGALVLGVVFGPLYALWSWYRVLATLKHFNALCQMVGASGDGDDQFQTKVLGNHRIHLIRLSESMRTTFVEAPLVALPWWLRNRTSARLWPYNTGSAQLLKEFPYQPININHGPLLLLLSSCKLPHPFVIAAGKPRRRSSDDKHGWSHGDREFEQRVSVRCDDHSFMRDYLTPFRRSAIMQLFELGFTQVMYVKQTCSLILVSNSRFLLRDAHVNAGRHILDLFARITPEITDLTPHEEERLNVSHVVRGRFRVSEHVDMVYAVPLGLLFAIYLFGHDAAFFLVPSIRFVTTQIVVSGILLLLAVLLFRDFVRYWGIWFVFVIIALPFPIGRGMAMLNRTLDRSTPQEVVATVGKVSTHKIFYEYGHRIFSITHYVVELTLSEPRSQPRPAFMEVPKDVADQLQAAQGRQSRIFLKAGGLGFEHLTGKIELLD